MSDQSRHVILCNGYLFAICDLYEVLAGMGEISNKTKLEISDRLRHSLNVREATWFKEDKETLDLNP